MLGLSDLAMKKVNASWSWCDAQVSRGRRRKEGRWWVVVVVMVVMRGGNIMKELRIRWVLIKVGWTGEEERGVRLT